MLITIDLNEYDFSDIRQIAEQQNRHEKQVIETAITDWLKSYKLKGDKKAVSKTEHPLRQGFGLWRDTQPNLVDGLTYQQNIRAEWD